MRCSAIVVLTSVMVAIAALAYTWMAGLISEQRVHAAFDRGWVQGMCQGLEKGRLVERKWQESREGKPCS